MGFCVPLAPRLSSAEVPAILRVSAIPDETARGELDPGRQERITAAFLKLDYDADWKSIEEAAIAAGLLKQCTSSPVSGGLRRGGGA
jgi:hypothetical protein